VAGELRRNATPDAVPTTETANNDLVFTDY
jgi:hypothetical protein